MTYTTLAMPLVHYQWFKLFTNQSNGLNASNKTYNLFVTVDLFQCHDLRPNFAPQGHNNLRVRGKEKKILSVL